MNRSLVPRGFDVSSHKCFAQYESPITVKRDLTEIRVSILVAESESMCPICLLPPTDPLTLTHCKHSFCNECIIHWLKINTSCPVCKAKVEYFLKGVHSISLKLYEIQDGQLHSEIDESDLRMSCEKHVQNSRTPAAVTCSSSSFEECPMKRKQVEPETIHTFSKRPKNLESFSDEEYKIEYDTVKCVGSIHALQSKGCFLEFEVRETVFDIQHVYVAPRFRSKGVADRLVFKAVNIAEGIALKVKPTCSYVQDTFVPKYVDLKSNFVASAEAPPNIVNTIVTIPVGICDDDNNEI